MYFLTTTIFDHAANTSSGNVAICLQNNLTLMPQIQHLLTLPIVFLGNINARLPDDVFATSMQVCDEITTNLWYICNQNFPLGFLAFLFVFYDGLSVSPCSGMSLLFIFSLISRRAYRISTLQYPIDALYCLLDSDFLQTSPGLFLALVPRLLYFLFKFCWNVLFTT